MTKTRPSIRTAHQYLRGILQADRRNMERMEQVVPSFNEQSLQHSLLRTAVLIAEKTCGPECDALSEAYSGMYALYATQGKEAEAKKYEEMAMNARPARKRASRDKE